MLDISISLTTNFTCTCESQVSQSVAILVSEREVCTCTCIDGSNMASDNFLCLKVNQEQKNSIKQLFQENDWSYDEMILEPLPEGSDHGDSRSNDGDDIPGYIIEQTINTAECPHCLCKPCITSEQNKQLWWPDRLHTPSIHNNKPRKDAFKRFWTMLYHRNVWLDERYIVRKREALDADPRYHHYTWIHRRDIMPDCVLDCVRTWYPNPKNVPYMGHKWE